MVVVNIQTTMASRKFMIMDINFPSTAIAHKEESTDWSKCAICQEDKHEPLQCPMIVTILHKIAFDEYKYKIAGGQEPKSYDIWITDRKEASPHFNYWNIILDLALLILIFV